MKRDLDLLRSILEQAEAQPAGEPLMFVNCDSGFSDADVAEHVALLFDAGLAQGQIVDRAGAFVVTRLTNAGHDFIASARTPSVWERAKASAGNAPLDFFVNVVSTLAADAIKKSIGLP